MSELRDCVRAGGVVAFPTETVYGVAVDPMIESAIERVFSIKERDRGKPLTLHISDKCVVDRFAVFESEEQRRIFDALTSRFWPGPLTVILPKAEHVSSLLTGGLDTVAFRFPTHPVALDFISACGGAVAGTSANLSGSWSTASARDVMHELGGKIEYVLGADSGMLGIESTVLSLRDGLRILRYGAVGEKLIAAVLEHEGISVSAFAHEAPEQAASRHKVRLYDESAVTAVVQELIENPHCAAVLLSDSLFYNIKPLLEDRRVKSRFRILSKEGYITKLYRVLRSLDGEEIEIIYAPRLEGEGIELAINRLLV